MKKILIIEDDQEIAELERDYLEASQMQVTIINDGLEGRKVAMSEAFDLAILDLMLPGLDGFNLCRDIRQHYDYPIVIVSARQTDIDKIRTFGLGADDYMTKPFSPSEMVARVKAHLARYEQLKQNADQSELSEQLKCGGLIVEPAKHRVLLNGEEIMLPNREFELLVFLMQNRGIVFSRNKLFETIWGLDALGDTATIAVHINRLREKIETDTANPYYIETIRGAGYRFRNKDWRQESV